MFDKVYKNRRRRGRYCPAEQKCLRWKHRSHRRQQIAGSYSNDHLPVSLKIDPYKQKKGKQVQLQLPSATRNEPEKVARRSRLSQIIFIRNKHKDSYDDSEKGCYRCKRWFFGRKAAKEIISEEKQHKKRANEWRDWKFKEAERAIHAQQEEARLKREAEFARQVYEVQRQRAELAKHTAKTKYPYPVHNKKIPNKSFTSQLSTTPYFPKRISKVSSEDSYIVEHAKKQQKRESKTLEKEEKRKEKEEKRLDKAAKKIAKEEKKQSQKEIKRYTKELKKLQNAHHKEVKERKPSKIRTYVKKLSLSKDKDYHYGPYEEYYDKPEEKKKRMKESSYTDYSYPRYDNLHDNSVTKKKLSPFSKKPGKEYLYDIPEEKMIPCTDTCKTKSKREHDYIPDAELQQQYNDAFNLTKNVKPKKMTKKEKKRKKKEEKLKRKTEKRMAKRLRSRQKHQKFVNCFYKVCCECFCCLTFLLIIGIAVLIYI